LWLFPPFSTLAADLFFFSTPVTTGKHSHSHEHHTHPHADVEGEPSSVTRIQRLAMFLEAHFGEVELHMPDEDAEEEQPKPKKDDDGEEKDAEDGEDEEDTARREEPALLVSLDEAFAQISLLSLVSCAVYRVYLSPTFLFFLLYWERGK
jgi:cleavage and polyadenylation specificity factor subunit 3